MKDKRVVYCEYRFWNKFFALEEEVVGNREKRRSWDNFDCFLENSILNFNINKSEIDETSAGGSALFDIFQKRGGANIYFLPDNFPSLEDLNDDDDDFLNSVLLKDISTEDCITLSQKTGVLVFNTDMIFSADHIYKNNGISFTKNCGFNWDFMLELKKKSPSISYCNSLIIADRYLLANLSDEALDLNLRPILDALLPETLGNNICFNICIVSENICSDINVTLNKIRNVISKIRKNLNFSIDIYNSKKLHDRSILTNNILLTSGAGFIVIGKDKRPTKFTTTMLIFPFIQNNEMDNVYYVDWIKNILQEEGKCNKYNENYWGDTDTHHHMLNFYYEEPKMPHSTFTIGNDDIKKRLMAAILANNGNFAVS